MIASLTAASIGLVGSTAYFSPWLWRQSRMAAIRNDLAEKRVLALTYDDGPSESLTPQLLNLLRKRNATATFFVIGENAKRYPELIKRILQEGHDVGCHSGQHLNAWFTTPWRAVADIDAGYEMLSPWIDSNAIFRPPFGKMTLPTYWSIRRRRASVWWWTIDSGDTYKRIPRSSQIVDAVHRQRGGIVLMHDVERSKEQKNFVLETTAGLLDLAQRESLHIKPLRDLCQ